MNKCAQVLTPMIIKSWENPWQQDDLMNSLYSLVLVLTLCIWQGSWGLRNHCTIYTRGLRGNWGECLEDAQSGPLTQLGNCSQGFPKGRQPSPKSDSCSTLKITLNKSKNQQIRPDMDLLRLNSWEVKCQGLRRSEHHSKVRLHISPQSQETANFCASLSAGAPWQTQTEGGTLGSRPYRLALPQLLLSAVEVKVHIKTLHELCDWVLVCVWLLREWKRDYHSCVD